jgi:hypothetical protein
LSAAIGLCSARGEQPSAGASTAIVSPGCAATASYRRAPSADSSVDARRRPVVRSRFGTALTRAGADADENARAKASAASPRVASMCARTNCSICSLSVSFRWVMPSSRTGRSRHQHHP